MTGGSTSASLLWISLERSEPACVWRIQGVQDPLNRRRANVCKARPAPVRPPSSKRCISSQFEQREPPRVAVPDVARSRARPRRPRFRAGHYDRRAASSHGARAPSASARYSPRHAQAWCVGIGSRVARRPKTARARSASEAARTRIVRREVTVARGGGAEEHADERATDLRRVVRRASAICAADSDSTGLGMGRANLMAPDGALQSPCRVPACPACALPCANAAE
jgi:hypothetical protein